MLHNSCFAVCNFFFARWEGIDSTGRTLLCRTEVMQAPKIVYLTPSSVFSELLSSLCQNSCWCSFYMLVTFCNIKYCADATIFSPIYLYSCSPHPLYIGMLSPHYFFVVFMLILPDGVIWCFLLLLLLLVKCLQSKFGLC